MASNSVDTRPNCVMGNGKCPPECPLHNNSTAISEEQGKKIDPFMSRLAVVFGDAFNHKVNVVDVAAVMGRCLLENQKHQTN